MEMIAPKRKTNDHNVISSINALNLDSSQQPHGSGEFQKPINAVRPRFNDNFNDQGRVSL